MLHLDAEEFVGIAFLLFLCVLAYAGVHKKIVAALDARINGVKIELAEAQRLRDEAQALLASFEQKRRDAEMEAANIVSQAKDEAALLGREAQARLNDYIARRTKQAEEKITMAETQAASDVRAAAAEAAVKAAEIVLKADSTSASASALVDKGIQDIGRIMH